MPEQPGNDRLEAGAAGQPSAPPSPLERKRMSIAVTCAVFAAVLLGAPVLQLFNRGLGLWLTELVLLLGMTWGILRGSGIDPPRYVGLDRPRISLLMFGFGLGITNYLALVIPLQSLSGAIFPRFIRDFFDIGRLLREQSSFQLWLIISAACLAAPLCEEFVFRGVIQRGFMPPVFRPRHAILLTAVLFSLFHLDPVGFLARVELGTLFGLLCHNTGSLWPGISAHAANNLVSTALYFIATSQGTKPDSEPELTAVFATAALGGLLLAGILWLGRRAGITLFSAAHDRQIV